MNYKFNVQTMYLLYVEFLPDADEETEGSGSSSRKKLRKSHMKDQSVGCNGSLSWMEMIHLHTKLEDLQSGKIFLPEVDVRLKLLEREQ